MALQARLTITGREDDLVKVDGKRVALGEVEGCLEAFPKVKAAQARIVADDLGGPMVVARYCGGTSEAQIVTLRDRAHDRTIATMPGNAPTTVRDE